MNIDEIFKPHIPDDNIPSKKRKVDANESDINEENDEIVDINEGSVKQLLSKIEKKLLVNQERRTKYSDNAMMFLDSEVELYESINTFMEVTNYPQYYPMLIENCNMITTILSLIVHENTDVCLATVKLIQLITEPNDLDDLEEGFTTSLVEQFLKGKLISHCIDILAKLDENLTEESMGVFNILNIIENLTELNPDCKAEIANQKCLSWLLKRIQKRTFDDNKLYVSEILAILLIDCKQNQEKLGELDGIDTLLTQLAIYKRNDPTSMNEFEMMENLFDTLCYALFVKSNYERFLKGEGLQLMVLMLRERKLSRNSAFKVLDMSTNGIVGDDYARTNCNKFVDILGLRVIFSYFMRTPDPRKTAGKTTSNSGGIPIKLLAKSGPNKAELEDHIVNIMTNLIVHTDGTQKSRILNKFKENNCEKVERLVELHMKYLRKIDDIDATLENRRRNKTLWGDLTSEEIEDKLKILRLDEGLGVLQNVDIIIADICVNGDKAIVNRILELFKMHSLSPRSISRIIEDFKNSLVDNKAENNSNKEWLDGLLRKFVPLIP